MSIVISLTKFALLLVLLSTGSDHHRVRVGCFTLNYPSFPQSVSDDFIKSAGSNIVYDALQVTLQAQGGPTAPLSGRILYNKRFDLWSRGRIASFNSTFVFYINPQPDGGGEGLAFVLTKDPTVPPNSEGQWLGIVNASTNGSSESSIVAVEFDTKKSFAQDVDDNHVGLDVNSVYSKTQVSLNSSDITIASASFITAMILYDGRAKIMNVSVFKGNQTGLKPDKPIISVPLDIALYLPSQVYVGFSASTGSGSELNCVQKWYFNGDDIDPAGMPLWVWALIPAIIVLLLSFLSGGYWYRRIKSAKRGHCSGLDDSTIQRIETGLGPQKIKLKDLKAATGNFSAKNEIGRGGFGIVYHGTWEGNEVAIKRITNTPQGKLNLIAEVTTIGSLHHKNLVELVGWCYESDELLLVYEYMPNGSLDKFLYTKDEKRVGKEVPFILSWERRHNIICGVAQALDYLHNECSKRVLHRDIKASNIMLDSEFNARLGDFGLARMFKLSEKAHHSTKEIAGTPGYMAPEIFLTGRTSAETDIFAFGVLILVVTTGKKPGLQNDQESKYMSGIIDQVWELYKLEKVTDAIDTKLKRNFDESQAKCMVVLGLACCHPNPYMRPSMRTALRVLMEGEVPPSVPIKKPAFIWPATPPSFTQEELLSGGILTTLSSLSGR